ncbi:hypothetical protein [Erythrobacter donghaensis]|uniref:hypothetical protein n=1 Tax=Erythrobacter donghaensis TaxID=267135 RepID=UPI0011807341|nr:hypothetical protein [Erythrobacter donghaensis]
MKRFRRSALLLIAPLGVIACKPASTTVGSDLPIKIDFSDGFQQSDAYAILHKCNAKNIELTVMPSGELKFEPSPNSDYDASVCVLEYIKKSGAPIGLVGNAKYVTPEEGQ